MNAPLHVDLIYFDQVYLPVVFFQGRQWVPLDLLATHAGASAQNLIELAEDASLAQGQLAVLPVEGHKAALLCMNRTDLPLLLARLGEARFNPALYRLWKAHQEGRMARDAALSELHLQQLESLHQQGVEPIH